MEEQGLNGVQTSSKKKKRIWLWIVGIIVVLGIIGQFLSDEDRQSINSASEAAEYVSKQLNIGSDDVLEMLDEIGDIKTENKGVLTGYEVVVLRKGYGLIYVTRDGQIYDIDHDPNRSRRDGYITWIAKKLK